MTRLVVGPTGALARALGAVAPPERMGQAVAAILEQQPTELAIIGTGGGPAPLGATPTDDLSAALDRTVGLALVAVKVAGQLEHPVRIALIAPAAALMPDHADGVRSVAGAGLAMLGEIAAATPGMAASTVAVADGVPPEEVAAVVDLVLGGTAPALNGATIRLDGGRDAVLAAATRAEEG